MVETTKATIASAIAGTSIRAVVVLGAVAVFLALTGGFIEGELAVAEKFAYFAAAFYFGTKQGS